MKINLLNLRFEIAEDLKKIDYLEFTAEGFIAVPNKPKASYASVVEESVPPTPDESRDLTIDDFRGCRKLKEIKVETYDSEDYCLEAVEDHIKAETEVETPMSGATSPRERSDHSHSEETIVLKELYHDQNTVISGHNKDAIVRPKSQSPPPKLVPDLLHFYSGNPCVEKVKGILHVYKDRFDMNPFPDDKSLDSSNLKDAADDKSNHQISLNDDSARSELICMLAVPARYTIHDLLKFNGPCLRGIQYMRIIRDGSPNQYMVLVKFKTQRMADEYYNSYNNTAYNSIESDVCHLVYVGRVEMLKESEDACLPVPGMTELPNCPVCLERMDESVDGILTILCNHAFHMECLDKWGDTSCPVCRYCQTPEEVADNRCTVCGSQDSLWICLICGHVGCGRYVGLHAYRHFQETHHTYAMELGNNKVWDYVGDNYVHRLVQNKSDGKLVKVDERGNPVQEEKLDALNLEYTYLLTNQLESQRLFFEEKIETIEKAVLQKVHDVEEENRIMKENCHKLQSSLDDINREKKTVEKRCVALETKLKKSYHDLIEEKALNKALSDNQSGWQKRVLALEEQFNGYRDGKEKEVSELKDQIQDLMFHMEAQQKLQGATGVSQEEIEDSQVVIGASGGQGRQTRKTRKKVRP